MKTMKRLFAFAALAIGLMVGAVAQTIPQVDLVNPQYLMYGPHTTITVPSTGPFVLENTLVNSDVPPMRVYISGGLLTAVSYRQYLWDTNDWLVLGTVPSYIDLLPGDSLRFTYTPLTPPVLVWHPI